MEVGSSVDIKGGAVRLVQCDCFGGLLSGDLGGFPGQPQHWDETQESLGPGDILAHAPGGSAVQFLYQHRLTPRQQAEARAREISRKRREKAEREKQHWEEKKRKQALEDPAEAARKKSLQEKEQKEMRLHLDEQLSNQRKRHAKLWGIRYHQ